VLREGFLDSPLYNGSIKGIGPRYCPSIEDKIVTFGEKEHHQLFLEPEGWKTNEYYINGFSSSLPLSIQFRALRKIKGLENVKIYRPGYAIEYDYFLPTQLFHSLESKVISSLFFAGQINGTTGYEEAAAQGLMAGINACRKLQGMVPVVLKREQAYIGVLIDDLVTKGVDEPYRMFTSRSEFRVLLRQDNADERLGGIGVEIGLAGEERKLLYKEKSTRRAAIKNFLRNVSITPEQINPLLGRISSSPIKQKVKLIDVLMRPGISLLELISLIEGTEDLFVGNQFYWNEFVESVEIEEKYSGYIERDRLFADKVNRLEKIIIDSTIDFDSLQSISTEGRQKLKRYKPATIGQASRISGVSPSDINVLLVYMGR